MSFTSECNGLRVASADLRNTWPTFVTPGDSKAWPRWDERVVLFSTNVKHHATERGAGKASVSLFAGDQPAGASLQ